MALAFTFRSAIHSTTAATEYTTTTGAFTPGANSLMVAFIVSRGAVASPSGVSGNGATYAQIAGSVIDEDLAGTATRGEVWVADSGGTPTNTEVTATGWGTNRAGCSVVVVEVTGADLSGGAAGAIVQSPTNDGATVNATSGSVTLAAAGAAGNRPIVCFAHGANEATTFRTDWDELNDGNYNTPATGVETQSRTDAFETTASASWASSVDWLGMALEIKAAVAAGTHAHHKVNQMILKSKLQGLTN